MQKFGIGQPATRIEDNRFLSGKGSYIEDINIKGQSYAAFVRSPHAHATISSINISEANSLPGVLGIFTVEDLKADGIGNLPCAAPAMNKDGTPCVMPPRPALAEGRVRHVGDAVAVVVAETREQALDAAEQVWVEYELLTAVVETDKAMHEGSSLVWKEAQENQCFDWEAGEAEATEQAFSAAKHIAELDLINNRVVPTSMETRGAIASVEAETGRLTLHVSCQGVHVMRRLLATQIFNVAEEEIHVICNDVGGGFGMKIFLFPEYVCTLYAARKFGRAVKWISDRNEAFVSDSHGRDHVTRMQLALDQNAKILGLKVNTVANLGAYLSNFAPFVATAAGVPMLVGCYAIPTAYVEIQGVFTNTTPVDAYRGAGRPEAIYAIERLLDAAAFDLGLSPAEIRRRNFITPEAMPYSTALGATYDSGEFQKNLEDALEMSDWNNFDSRRTSAKTRGKLLGIGLASYIEKCAGGSPEQARLEVSEEGHVTLYIGTLSNGQGHETAFRQILCDRLGVAFENVSIVQGDSDLIETGGGTMGSRSVPVGGSAIGAASKKIIDKAKETAAELMESAVSDIEFDDGEFRIVGTDRVQSFNEVAKAAASESGVAFDEKETFTPDEATYPNGTHICELEIDEATGVIELVDYSVVDDFGKVINPLLLEGQVHGGIAQGLGQALLESCEYEKESGQLLSASFMDYTMPRADDFPPIRFNRNEVPCTTNPLGIKGAGEAGAIGAPPAIINAIVNALSDYGVRHVDMPVTPNKLWGLMQSRN
ncbi:MAG: xanthine dehydrogenase family protein molybdopterin-binding subunit [Gammaproteobacteria bacterium]|jgi:aerobic carbon-monoxide dehydrogenase large subunit|nr:xanthine dehydrogenase family protein molybdopterin-binding subunit [Gammaproteobacteria bacterium]